MNILQESIFGNSVQAWMAAGAVALLVYFFLHGIRRYIGRRLSRLAERTSTDLDNLVVELVRVRTKRGYFVIYALYAASLVLVLPSFVEKAALAAVVLALAVQAGIWGNGVINFFVNRRASREGEDGLNLEAYSVITWIAKSSLWVLVILLVLHNLGIQITALVAGLGISGIAVALAVQNILGDLFASLSIVMDRPFVIGDFIIVGEQMGTVEHVGLKTTRLRSLSGEQIVFSNTDLLGSRIRNFRRMNERRVLFTIGVIYQTPLEKLEKIPGILREIIEGQEQVRFERAHFATYGAFSLDFEIVYWVLDRDYLIYRDVQQKINLEIFRRFDGEGIEFAYPTQTLFLEGTGVKERS